MTALAAMGMMSLKQGRPSNFHGGVMFFFSCCTILSCCFLAFYAVNSLGERAYRNMERYYFDPDTSCDGNNDSSLFCVRNITSERRR